MTDHNDSSYSKARNPEEGFIISPKKQYLVDTKFEIPIYIPIPDGKYEVHANSMNALVRLRRIIKPTIVSKSVKTSKNVISFVPNLRYDPFNSTEVTMRFKPSHDTLHRMENPNLEETDPYTNGPIDPLMKECLLFLNKIVTTYQYYSGNSVIGKVQTWDIGVFNAHLMPYPIKSPSTVKIISQIGYSRATIHTNGPPTNREVLNQMVDAMKRDWSISVDSKLLLTARHLYLMGEYSAAVITAQTAVELFLSKLLSIHIEHIIIHSKRKEERIPVEEAGLFRMTKFGLKQAFGRSLSEIDSSLNQEVTKSRKLRNDIVHEGLDATMIDADKCIRAFSKTIDKLDSEL
jgi:hypothetical protein